MPRSPLRFAVGPNPAAGKNREFKSVLEATARALVNLWEAPGHPEAAAEPPQTPETQPCQNLPGSQQLAQSSLQKEDLQCAFNNLKMRHFFPIRQVFSHTRMPSGLSPCQSFSSTVDVRQVTHWCKEASFHPCHSWLGWRNCIRGPSNQLHGENRAGDSSSNSKTQHICRGQDMGPLLLCWGMATMQQHDHPPTPTELLKLFHFERKMRCFKHSSVHYSCK